MHRHRNEVEDRTCPRLPTKTVSLVGKLGSCPMIAIHQSLL
jgi:hypothetical protein